MSRWTFLRKFQQYFVRSLGCWESCRLGQDVCRKSRSKEFNKGSERIQVLMCQDLCFSDLFSVLANCFAMLCPGVPKEHCTDARRGDHQHQTHSYTAVRRGGLLLERRWDICLSSWFFTPGLAVIVNLV